MAPFHSRVPVSQHAYYQDRETEAAKWIIYFIYICAFPTVKCQNVFCETVLLIRGFTTLFI